MSLIEKFLLNLYKLKQHFIAEYLVSKESTHLSCWMNGMHFMKKGCLKMIIQVCWCFVLKQIKKNNKWVGMGVIGWLWCYGGYWLIVVVFCQSWEFVICVEWPLSTCTSKGLQIQMLLVLLAIEQQGFHSVPYLLWHETFINF